MNPLTREIHAINLETFLIENNFKFMHAYYFNDRKYERDLCDHSIDPDHIFYGIFMDFYYTLRANSVYYVIDENYKGYYIMENDIGEYVFITSYIEVSQLYSKIKKYLVRLF